MNGFTLLIGSAVIFLIAYVVYGSWLAKQWGIDPTRKTPAETQKDGIDYLPTKPAVLLGHHFSSIAGAGPIVGPITAAVFGWVPVTLWIIVGSVFFGGVHDYGSLVASLRHKGKSIGQIIEANIGEKAKILFAIFAWITLLVVIAAFANIVAATFVANPGAGTSSLLFILLAVAFGLLVYRTGMSLFLGTVLGLIGMAAAFYIGHIFPIVLSKDMWLLIMMGYIFVASIAPVWILLQPRDYLNSFLLYLMIIAAFLGICFYQPTMEISPFVGFDLGGGQWLFPVLFVTVACGAISGFHSLVSSGTSSKQLDNEKNANHLKENKELDQRTCQKHLYRGASSNLLYANVLDDEASSIFSGMILVAEGAHDTSAYQSNRNLILSPRAEANSIPGLEILADRVQCSHGSATSSISPEEIFYLLSRGIPEQTARRMIAQGFLKHVLDQFGDETIRTAVESIILP